MKQKWQIIKDQRIQSSPRKTQAEEEEGKMKIVIFEKVLFSKQK